MPRLVCPATLGAMCAAVYYQIAVPTPLRRCFTYLPPRHAAGNLHNGCRVKVPFGRRQVIGVIVGNTDTTQQPVHTLKRIAQVIDEQPLWEDELWQLLNWSARYYQHPLGDVLHTALPALLRQGHPARAALERIWHCTEQGRTLEPASLRRAPRQLALLTQLQQHHDGMHEAQLRQVQDDCLPVLKRLQARGWVECTEQPSVFAGQAATPQPGPVPNPEQARAVATVSDARETFNCFALDGVTGSGKTEVYLQLIERCLADGKQALVLVPEIGLTPQMIRRFETRLGSAIAVLHSGLNDSQRLAAWVAARDAQVPVILGTRSAIFTPLARPGLIIIDEEHDTSFKQQDGFRYSARDLAIWRARQNNIPVVLGSATLSVETLYNVRQGRFTPLHLTERAGVARPPALKIIDARAQPMYEGLTDKLMQVMQQHLARHNQVLLFLNRRGFAPTLMCHDCGWVAKCQRCDSHMTYHHSDRRLRCHHCGAERRAEKSCAQCQSENLLTLGAGTERIEQALQQRFAGVEIVRIDRDTTRRRGSLEALLDRVKTGQRQILVGTQMLAKGHHFPNVTLVGIVDADQGLHSAEFHAPERMAQLILQVAGRAGRAEQPGEVYIQTHHPDHPLLLKLIEHGYGEFARALLREREAAALPPFTAMALLRAEAVQRDAALAFLEQVRMILRNARADKVQIFGPLPAPMEKRAGRFRAQLIVQAQERGSLQQLLQHSLPQVEAIKSGRVRWSVDVDPVDTY